ncbi:hypothetical protein HUT19_10910 [Streptomyces sp. NA02950]|uniref:hypothetical protein n=1 Tax=Streptomyces sp. NA02950 TaxID=2742137 RepID=UPI001590DCEB|nr:hypothetical protein [Streptomyces sp. NA02950]QKV92193.1 hypothetical protein HUT19_10910 [Streptomyces sp. NA02950]
MTTGDGTTWWGLLMEDYLQIMGPGARNHSITALGHVRGTREEALEALCERALHYQPRHPVNPYRKLVYRDGDVFLMVLEAATGNYCYRFRVAELLWDSAPRPETAG